MRTADIRQRWIDYFESKDHHIEPSASLVSPDPSLLFTVAGMVPFIPYIIGTETSPHARIASVQKCIRTKDIEEVGKTTRHGTFFQMLGNFSFGDYFKEGAIDFAWDLLTGPESEGKYGLDPERLWVTTWKEDAEAHSALRAIGVPAAHVVHLEREENFWDTGQPGPAGPCAEWHYDRGPEFGPEAVGGTVDPGGDRYLEIWNLVFDQFLRGPGSGKDYPLVRELDQKAIDTGAGLERIAYLKQGVSNMYEIDEVFPVIAKASELSGKAYKADAEDDVRLRVIADHVRSSMMLINDGIVPGNEGRGYVLRRLLRRTVRSMRLLGVEDPSMAALVRTSFDAMKPSYPELGDAIARIENVAVTEEDAFRRTLTQGTTIFDTAVAKAKQAGSSTLSGADAFRLHDTSGFPIDLTLEMAAEQGVTVDEGGFRALMNEQKERARADAKAKKGAHADVAVYQAVGERTPTEFRGYDELSLATSVVAVIKDGVSVPVAKAGDTVEVILAQTPFYAESGGQDADTGEIRGGHATLNVIDVQKPVADVIVHTVTVEEGEIAAGDQVSAEVDVVNRRLASKAHSATHLIHSALHQVLGDDATQAGSYNKPGYMRLDFAWRQGISHTAREEIEGIANRAIREELPVATNVMSLDEAKGLGAMALFGEKYGDRVRVVEIGGPFSRELCAGTHVENSSQIGLLSVTSEGSVGSGARRIEALVGADAFSNLAAERSIVNELTTTLKARPEELSDRIGSLLSRLSEAEKQLAQYRQQAMQQVAAQLVETAADVAGVRVVAHESANASDGDDLRTLVTDVRSRLGEAGPSVVAASAAFNGRPQIVIATNQAARDAGLRAGDLVKVASSVLGGGGGGKPDLAQGGGQDATRIGAALESVVAAVGNRG
ncbi:alanine--tRNA ligase [Demequina activiva]|uniref:Alanine--tRNA ligase n=1 Tax=Demequina activiva TaxID=1582364 RepID=A0A919Q5H3_9MICO|nr:alanine--tRNA ligase [Demequina activiva]GIG54633.1 alanine--tRNA ligase [Demequina activiva]